jgi:hypothetical protein
MCIIRAPLAHALHATIGDCDAPFDTSGWGFETSVCTRHYALATMLVRTAPDALAPLLDARGALAPGATFAPPQLWRPDDVRDYTRLFILMQTRAAVMTCIQRLNGEIGRTIDHYQVRSSDDLDDRFTSTKESLGHARLSRALSYYEQLCWFSPSQAEAGTRPATDVAHHLVSGLMPTRGSAEGLRVAMAHRLQWHAVMRVVTNGFTAPMYGEWRHTPLELYTGLGTGAPAARDLWGLLFDAPESASYSNPANLLHDIATSSLMALRTRLAATMGTGRFLPQEAGRELEALLAEPALQPVRAFLRTVGPRSRPQPPSGPEVAGIMHRWRRWGGRPAFPPGHFDGYTTPPVLRTFDEQLPTDRALYDDLDAYFRRLAELAALRCWERHIANPLFDKLLPGLRRSVHLTLPGRPPGTADVELPAPEAATGPGSIAARIELSQTGFNPRFTYSGAVGVRRVNA